MKTSLFLIGAVAIALSVAAESPSDVFPLGSFRGEVSAKTPREFPNVLEAGKSPVGCLLVPDSISCSDYRHLVRLAVGTGRQFKKNVWIKSKAPSGGDAEIRWRVWEALRAGAKGILIAAPAAKDAFGRIAPHKDRFLRGDLAPSPVFFATGGEPLKCQAFYERGAKERFGVLVNDDLKVAHEFTVKVTDNVVSVRDLNGGELALTEAKDGLKTFSVKLAPGDGMIVDARFAGGEPGIRFVHEDFGRTHWMGWANRDVVTLELDECLGLKGGNALRIKGDCTNALPAVAYWTADLANPESGGTWNMASMNVNAKAKRANLWIAFDAENDEGVELWAHMGDARNRDAKKVRFWKTGDPLPAEVPVGTGVAFVKLGSRSASLVSLDVWATPLRAPEPKDPPVLKSACAGKALPLKDDFPLGVYHGWERNDCNAKYAGLPYDEFVDRLMGVCKEMNCDTVWIVNGPRKGQRETFLKTCEKHGLKTLFNTGMENLQGYFHHEFDGDFGALQSAANRFIAQTTDSPAFWGYTTKDEPQDKLATQLDDFAEFVRRLDPAKRDTLACSTPPAAIPYLEATQFPVICTDPYCFGGPKSRGDVFAPEDASKRAYRDQVATFVKTARRSGKRLWVMPQAYSWVKGLEWLDRDGRRMMEKGSYWLYRMPTDAEIRWQAWEAVRAGAKGVVFYVLSDSWTMDEDYFEAAKTNRSYAAQVKRANDDLARVPEMRREAERHEIDPARALMLKGLEPSHQFRTLGNVFGRLKPHKKLLLAGEISRMKVLWNRKGFRYPLSTETFEVAGARSKYGVILNDDTEKEQELEVFTPGNVTEVKDLSSGTAYALSEVNDDMRSFRIRLAAGDGALVMIRFKGNEPGRSILYDDFTEPYRLGTLNEEYGDLCLSGKFFRSKDWVLKMKSKDQKYDGPMYTIDRIGGARDGGATWLMMNGYLHGVTVTAVARGADGKPERTVVFKPNGTLPARVPVNAESLEFNVSHHSSSIFDINLWYNPF